MALDASLQNLLAGLYLNTVIERKSLGIELECRLTMIALKRHEMLPPAPGKQFYPEHSTNMSSAPLAPDTEGKLNQKQTDK
jgi:hypothetical protein